jgi:hypothetical protein
MFFLSQQVDSLVLTESTSFFFLQPESVQVLSWLVPKSTCSAGPAFKTMN